MNRTPSKAAVEIAEAHIERSLHPGNCECLECTTAFLMVQNAALMQALKDAFDCLEDANDVNLRIPETVYSALGDV